MPLKTRVVHPWGFRQLDPLPTQDDVDALYRGGVYEQRVRDGLADPPFKRQMDGDSREVMWLDQCLHDDIIDLIDYACDCDHTLPIIDLGAGKMLAFAKHASSCHEVIAIDPALSSSDSCSGITQIKGNHHDMPDVQAKAIVMLQVLNHVIDPSDVMRAVNYHLAPGGVVVIYVPNDFSALQQCVKRGQYWVVSDHISYFTVASLRDFVTSFGLEVADVLTQYPMEFFLLQGDDYLSDPAVGAKCHERVREMELAMSVRVRLEIARAWAAAGVGRDILLCARKPV